MVTQTPAFESTIRVEPVTDEINAFWSARYKVAFPGEFAIVRRRIVQHTPDIMAVHGETGTAVVLDRSCKRIAGTWHAQYLPPLEA